MVLTNPANVLEGQPHGRHAPSDLFGNTSSTNVVLCHYYFQSITIKTTIFIFALYIIKPLYFFSLTAQKMWGKLGPPL